MNLKWSQLADQHGAAGTSSFVFPTSERAPAGICSLRVEQRCQNPAVFKPGWWEWTQNGIFQCPFSTGTRADTPAAAVTLLCYTGVLHQCCTRVHVVTFVLIHYFNPSTGDLLTVSPPPQLVVTLWLACGANSICPSVLRIWASSARLTL